MTTTSTAAKISQIKIIFDRKMEAERTSLNIFKIKLNLKKKIKTK